MLILIIYVSVSMIVSITVFVILSSVNNQQKQVLPHLKINQLFYINWLSTGIQESTDLMILLHNSSQLGFQKLFHQFRNGTYDNLPEIIQPLTSRTFEII
jgi:hypothetical protein